MLERYAYIWIKSRDIQQFLRDARRGPKIQTDLLLEKLGRNADTAFGRRHGFGQIHSVADFRRRVPIADYEYYRPYVERVQRGELDAMFGRGTRLLMFAMTSGTTAQSKYIPITQEFFTEYRRGWNLWGVATYADHTDLVRKKTLKLGSNWRQKYTEAGIPCGNISGLVAETAPLVGRNRFVLPPAVTQIDHPESKHYTALRVSLACPHVGMIGTANPSTLYELALFADRRRDALIRDIFNGTLADDAQLSRATREKLRRWIGRRQPGRARELEQLADRADALLPRDAWPGLSVIAVWTGGSVGVYLPRLEPLYGTPALRDHGLSASEGRMTIPLADSTNVGLLEYTHHFFEFIPEEERDSRSPVVLQAHELQPDRNYYILLSTSAGFYRYDIHDMVRCVGFEGHVPLLTFLNKGARFSSITGEKLSEYQVVESVRAAFREMGVTIDHFTLAPVMEDKPRYELLLEEEFCARMPEASLERLAREVDEQLQHVNWEYAEKRRSLRILPIRIRSIPPGTWAAYRRRRTSERGNFEEYKHPCLVSDLGFVDNLLSDPSGSPSPLTASP